MDPGACANSLAFEVIPDTRLLDAPGNVLLPAADTGLPRDSVANVSQVVTLDEDFLAERAGRVPPDRVARVDVGLRLVLELEAFRRGTHPPA